MGTIGDFYGRVRYLSAWAYSLDILGEKDIEFADSLIAILRRDEAVLFLNQEGIGDSASKST